VYKRQTPHRYGSRLFFPRRDVGKEKFTIYWREGKGGPDNVLLDPNTWSTDGSVSLGVWAVSHDGRRVAYTVKSNNSDEATLYVMDVATGKKSDIDVVEGAKYAWPSWTPSGKGFYYTRLPPLDSVPTADRPGYADVRFHELGADPKNDPVVRERTGDPKTFVSATVSKDGRWLLAVIEHGWTSTDVYFEDLREQKPVWRPLAVGNEDVYKRQILPGPLQPPGHSLPSRRRILPRSPGVDGVWSRGDSLSWRSRQQRSRCGTEGKHPRP